VAIAPPTLGFNVADALLNRAHESPRSHAKSPRRGHFDLRQRGHGGGQFVVGVATAVSALISEALHSSVDVVATVITWLVVRVSDRPRTTNIIMATQT